MWQDQSVHLDDPLRQGDLVAGVVFPVLKLPLSIYQVIQQDQTSTLAKLQMGIVVSQCCDNVDDNFAALAPITPFGNLKSHQLTALSNPEPVWDGSSYSEYDLDHFLLKPIDGVLEDLGASRHQVAHLNRIACFFGECLTLREGRLARMTVQSRRLLRIKLGLRWSRAEATDIADLAELGLPPGLSIDPLGGPFAQEDPTAEP